MPGRQVGPFLLESKIGAGAMGAVYRGRHAQTGQVVAVKLLPAEFAQNDRAVARFEREMEILRRLQHPNIVRCYGGGRHGEHRFFAMELVEGGSLAALLHHRGRLAADQVIEYGQQICAALEYAHRHGIVHRDLKPSNLLVASDGTLKLADFGLARDLDASGLTATGKTMGTFAYMAPEQISGKPAVSHKTDLYALGCVLFEMLTGRPPFSGDSPAQVFYQHLEAKPPRVATLALDCPIWLDAAVGQLLEKDPHDRPLDAIAVAQMLHEAQQKIGAEASTMQHAADGGPTALSVVTDTVSVQKLLAPKKRKRRKKGPIYERTWFIATCFLLAVSAVAWALWPPSERALIERARPLMASDDPLDWDKAQRRYLEPLQRRFPSGEHAAEVQQYVDRIEMRSAEARFRTNTRLGREPESEAERLFGAAWRYEQFGDRVSALENYRSMVKLLEGREAARPFVNLARRQIAEIEQAGGDNDDRQQIVTAALERADKLYADGQVLDARNIWTSIITLYQTNREMEPLVKRASDRLAGRAESSSQSAPAASSGADARAR